MPNGNGNGIWKTVAVTLIGALLTGAAAWLTLGRGAVDRHEVSAMIQTGACQEPEVRRIIVESSPYQQDKAVIKKSIDDLEKRVESLDTTVDGLRTEQTRLIERIDRVLSTRNP